MRSKRAEGKLQEIYDIRKGNTDRELEIVGKMKNLEKCKKFRENWRKKGKWTRFERNMTRNTENVENVENIVGHGNMRKIEWILEKRKLDMNFGKNNHLEKMEIREKM